MTGRASFVALVLLVAGCAGTTYDRPDDDSKLHRAAVSWVGGQVDEMIYRWGEPNRQRIDATETQDGLVRWLATNTNSGRQGARYYRCSVEVRFDAMGLITRVDTISDNCDQLYTDERLAHLTR